MKQNPYAISHACRRSRSTMVLSAGLFLLAASCRVSPQHDPSVLTHTGMCDASAAVSIGHGLFIAADDEDNILRVYRDDTSGAPVQTFDLGPFLKPDPRHPEVDIEGATRIGNRIYWIGSHGENKDGKPRFSRRRFFATDLTFADGGVEIIPAGKPYSKLVEDLSRAANLREFRLGDAAKIAPKEPGGLNIEGLAATPRKTLLIAFRNPVPDGKALLVPLENPADVIEGKTARFGNPVLLPLGGLGIRSIEYSETAGQYYIIAGPVGERGESGLYRWSGNAADPPRRIKGIDFSGMNPEALIVNPEEKSRLQILSDDGTRKVDGKECKHTAVENRSFRSFRVTP
jgi:hypothetical protein